MLIRPRRDDDLPALVEHLRGSHELDRYPMWPALVCAEWLTWHSGPAWVADTEAGPVAQVALDGDDPCELVRFFVGPSARGQGIAVPLLDHALAAARASGREPFLQVMQHNTGAIALYERKGWQRTSTFTATWSAPDGSHPTMHTYAPPPA